MGATSGRRQRTWALWIAWLLLCAGVVAQAPAMALATSTVPPVSTPAPTRPPRQVAAARVALVRILSYYIGSTDTSGPIPVQTACAADGVLVGTTGSGLNSYDYVLVPTAAVSPVTPCQGVQAAFQELYGTASSWSLNRITVLLSAAYTGTGATQLGSISYTVDLANITTDGGASGPQLLTLPLAPLKNAPAHDLPVLMPPQPSDAPASGPPTVLDLTGPTGTLLARDSLGIQDAATALYPVGLPATDLAQATPTRTPTPDTSGQNATGGTAVPNASSTTTAPSATPSPLATQLSIGAPLIDSNGRLVGMVISDGAGGHVVAPLSQVTAAIGAVSGKPGPLMTVWQQGLAAFYSVPPNYAQASAAFNQVRSNDPDFAGVMPFAAAAQHDSPSVASLTTPSTPTPGSTPGVPSIPGTQGSRLMLAVIGIGILLLLALVVLALVLVLRRRARLPDGPPPEERGLDLLPRESMFGPPPADDEPTARMASAAQRDDSPENAPTAILAAVRSAPATPRAGATLMPTGAGLTDPGTRRAAEPNQDNILALHGVRLAGTRPQPYGIFIVADGMGGHEHGAEASLATIEILTRTLMQTVATAQPLDADTVEALLRDGLQRAHIELRQRNAASGADMGTTITAAVTLDDTAHVASVGDSRTYVMSPDSGLRQVTSDHSVVASLVAAGVIRPEDIYTHPRRNQIYRSLGSDGQSIEVDTFAVALQAGDKLLLCSDGLWEMVRDPQIEQVLRATADPARAAAILVREANANGGDDNISVLVVRMVEYIPHGDAEPQMQVLVAPHGAQLPPAR